VTIAELYQHGTEKIGEVEIPEEFPGLPDILIVGDAFYRNVSVREEPGRATYWRATARTIATPITP
jgi:hypothetical protein